MQRRLRMPCALLRRTQLLPAVLSANVLRDVQTCLHLHASDYVSTRNISRLLWLLSHLLCAANQICATMLRGSRGDSKSCAGQSLLQSMRCTAACQSWRVGPTAGTSLLPLVPASS